jgi:hypothetical protein
MLTCPCLNAIKVCLTHSGHACDLLSLLLCLVLVAALAITFQQVTCRCLNAIKLCLTHSGHACDPLSLLLCLVLAAALAMNNIYIYIYIYIYVCVCVCERSFCGLSRTMR